MIRMSKCCKGQFIVAAAMFIGLIILSMSIIIYSAGSRYQTLEKEPVREIVQTVTDDFKRIMLMALADYSSAIFPTNKTGAQERPDFEEVQGKFNSLILDWCKKTMYGYSGLGLKLDVETRSLYPNDASEGYPLEVGPTFEIGVDAILKVEILSLGFYGYEYPIQAELEVAIKDVQLDYKVAGGLYTLKFLNITLSVNKENDLTVTDLDISSLIIEVKATLINGTQITEKRNIIENVDITRVSGMNVYNIKLNRVVQVDFGEPIKSISLNVYIEFVDGRGIQGCVKTEENEAIILKSMSVSTINVQRSSRNKNLILIYVTVQGEDGAAVKGATVYLSVGLPDGVLKYLSGKTDGQGIVNVSLNSKLEGKYTVYVYNVVKEGYYFQQSENDTWEGPL